jgi:hypothetical protein
MKNLITHLKAEWHKYLLEILVITLGILGAFALNNWNEKRKSQLLGEEIFSSLYMEFNSNQQDLKGHLLRLERLITSTELVLSKTTPSYQNGTLENIDSLISLILDAPTWNPSSFALSELQSSDQFQTFTSEDLRVKLFKWEQHFQNMLEWYDLFSNHNQRLIYHISEKGNWDKLGDNNQDKPSSFNKSNDELMRSLEYNNLLHFKLFVANNIKSQYLNVTIPTMEEILRQIENDLGKITVSKIK